MRGRIIRYSMYSLSYEFRRWRRDLKDRLPYVRQRVYSRLQARHEALADDVHEQLTRPQPVAIQARVPVPAGLRGEVCLFVTHAPQAQLKTHVLHHIEHLLRSGVQVALIVNTDLPPDSIEIAPALQQRLCGVYVRANRGFDFGAWCHVLRLCDRSGWERLYFVNDSIVGPVEAAAFDAMMKSIRASSAGVQGLTENDDPIPHLQSFFLVFHAKVLASPVFEQFVQGMVDFRDKEQVIEIYEVRLTRTLRQAGFEARPVFHTAQSPRVGRDWLGRWQQALRAGFPYVKTRVLQVNAGDERLFAVREQARVDGQV